MIHILKDKISLAIITILLLFFGANATIKQSSGIPVSSGDEKEQRLNARVRVVHFHGPVPEPLRIVRCVVGEGDNWLENLTIEVENISEQPVRAFTYNVLLPNSGNKQLPLGSRLTYGKELIQPLEKNNSILPNTTAILPGKTVQLTWPANYYSKLRSQLEVSGNITKVVEVVLVLQHVYFQNRTVWYGGQIKDFLVSETLSR
ncbi:MAG: hypothetical protein AB1489_07455 [Acidobacteriota bacterium]